MKRLTHHKKTTPAKGIYILLLMALLAAHSISGQENIEVFDYQAIQNSFDTQIVLRIEDPDLSTGISYTTHSNWSSLRLRFNHSQTIVEPFTIALTLNIIPLNSTGQLDTANSYSKNLSIDNNYGASSGNIANQAYHLVNNSFGAEVTVTQVSTTHHSTGITDNSVPINVIMELGFDAVRVYELDLINSPNVSVMESGANGENLTFSWTTIPGAVTYDLEWTWIDNYGENPNEYLTSSMEFAIGDFVGNNSRISIEGLSYEIPKIFDRGFILARVRAVGRFLDYPETILPGKWSMESSTYISDWGSAQLEIVNPHQNNKNWQYQASYAEEGKKKDVISYFDGTLRNRQTVTKISSDDNAIVGEVFYDNQGRPAVETLPVPVSETETNNLKFYDDFNQSSYYPNQIFSHLDFDWSMAGVECGIVANGMSEVSGASRYYSTNNISQGFQDYVPDANDFPFSQVEYTPDNTGRVKRKGGVGIAHQLGSNHEMKYFYGFPTQKELDRLFGSQVGWQYHYKKNTVVDPNGQVSVSYIDPQGRTIATALAGDNPIQYEELDDEGVNSTLVHDSFTEKLINENNNSLFKSGKLRNLSISDGLKYQGFRTSLSNNADFTFNYTLNNNDVFVYKCLNHLSNGYPYMFKLNFNVNDECGDSLLSNGPLAMEVGSLTTTPQTFNRTNLAGENEQITFDSVNLVSASNGISSGDIIAQVPLGDLGILKELTINEEVLDFFADDYILKAQQLGTGCILSPSDFNVSASMENCYETCQECLDSLGNETDYVQQQLEPYLPLYSNDQATIDGLTERFIREHELLLIECERLCSDYDEGVATIGSSDNITNTLSCSIIEDQLREDVSKYGQYGYQEIKTTVGQEMNESNQQPTAVTAEISIFNDNNQLYKDYAAYVRGESVPANAYTWRNPYNPNFTGSEAKHYFEADETTVSTIEIKLTNGVWLPQTTLSDSQLSSMDSDDNGVVKVEPQLLESVVDFIEYWKESWSKSLVIYHPEYCYAEYASIMCQLTSNIVSLNVQVNIDGFKNLLDDMDYADASAQGYLSTSGLTSILTQDPFFVNQLPSQLGSYLSNVNIHKDIMTEALNSDLDNSGKSLLSTAFSRAACNSIEICSKQLTNSNINKLTVAQKEELWQAYRGYYLSLRQRIYDAIAHSYALNNNCYNGCIGGLENDVPDLGLNAMYPSIPMPTQSSSAVCEGTSSLYLNNEKRYLTADALYESGNSATQNYDDLSAGLDIQSFADSGICPLGIDLKMFLNEYVNETYELNNGTLRMATVIRNNFVFTDNYLTMDLYTALGGVETSSTNTNSGISVNSQPSGSTELPIVISQGSTDLNPITLTLPAGENWSDFYAPMNNANSGKIIQSISEFHYTNYSLNPTTFNFEFLADVYQVNNHVVDDTTFQQIIISGYTSAPIGECFLLGQEMAIDGNGNPIGEDLGDGSAYGYAPCVEDAVNHVGLITLLNSASNNFPNPANTPLDDSEREWIGWNIVTFFNSYLTDPNYQNNLYVTNVHDQSSSPGYRIISQQRYLPSELGVTTSTGDLHIRVLADWSLPIFIQNNNYNNHFSTVTNALAYNANNITKPMDVLFVLVTADRFTDRASLFQSYSALRASGKANKIFFILLEGHNTVFDVQNNTLISPLEYLKLILGGPKINPIEYTPELGLLKSNYVSFTETEWATTTALGDFLTANYNPETVNYGDSCMDCIPPTVTVVNHSQKYTDYASFMASNIPDFIIPDYYDAKYFADMKYGLIVDGYTDYLNTLGITTVTNSDFITLPDFGATKLNYGYSDYTTFINLYNDYLNSNPEYPYQNWPEFVNDFVEDNPSICPPKMVEQNIDITLPPQDPCQEFKISVSEAYGADNYASYIERLKREFKLAYIQSALQSVDETLDMTYFDKEYQYTLYNYDQAGNLTNTVPPQGVHRKEFSVITDANGDSKYDVDRQNNSVTETLPDHKLKTLYKYNSLNQLVWQKTPDGGETYFAYDELGRIIASQNSKQSVQGNTDVSSPNYQLSYTNYDELGRIEEAGEIALGISTGHDYTINDSGELLYNGNRVNDFEDVLGIAQQNEVTRTIYDDIPDTKEQLFEDYSFNDQNRVTAILYFEQYSSSAEIDNAIYYDYDVHGNVKELVTEINDADLIAMGHNVKNVSYEYDLISGNVNYVYYQKDELDQFVHRYEYDADNRITGVYTSNNGKIWEKDADYQYYEHGPLARTVIGDTKVQGLDYAYTIQGWLKGINGDNLYTADIGNDGNNVVAKDAFAFSLSYYNNYTSPGGSTLISDYKPRVGTDIFSNSKSVYAASTDLYNGNIRGMTTAMMDIDQNNLKIANNTYGYDQLNRIKNMQNQQRNANGSGSLTSGIDTDYSYDKNGNLITLNRSAFNSSGSVEDMDQLSYDYYTDVSGQPTNKLKIVHDNPLLTSNFNTDIDNHTNDYKYDAIGQLTEDIDEGILGIEWRVDGKVKKITKSDGFEITFGYDGLGNRLYKRLNDNNKTTYYLRDAQGNVLSVYEYDEVGGANNLVLREQHIFGSSRQGMQEPYLDVNPAIANPDPSTYYNIIGDKRYELTNHLGNVLAVVSDRKLQENGNFTADVLSYNDYYPFGMLMPNRHGSSDGYRYGFQGQEKDDEIKGEGNSLNYTFRMHDPRVGRFFAPDPLSFKYPSLSSYQFSANTPIMAVELEGLESSDDPNPSQQPLDGPQREFVFIPDGGIPLSEVVVRATVKTPVDSNYDTRNFDGRFWSSEVGRYETNGSFEQWKALHGRPGETYTDATYRNALEWGSYYEAKFAKWDKEARAELLMQKLFLYTVYFYMAEDLMMTYSGNLGLSAATAKVTTKSYSFSGILSKTKSSETLFHYTSEEGYWAILESMKIKPSIGVKNARFGSGQYFTDIVPGTVTPGELSARLFRVPWNTKKITHFIEIDIKGLDIIKNHKFNYLNPSESSLDLGNRLRKHGLSF